LNANYRADGMQGESNGMFAVDDGAVSKERQPFL